MALRLEPTMTSYRTPPKQPYSLLIHRDGKVDIIYDQPRTSSHQPSATSAPKGSPRSTAATFGSSNTRIASSSAHRDSSTSSSKHLAPEAATRQHHHHHHRHSSESHRTTPGLHHLSPPHSGEQPRQRHHSTTSAERPSLPIPIPAPAQSHSRSHDHSRSRSRSRSPQGSPQKLTRFAVLPSTSPKVTSSGHLAAPTPHYGAQESSGHHRSLKHQSSNSALLAVPTTTSRHRPSSSADSFFFLQSQSQPHRPKGWYNRRGDRFVQKGVVERPVAHFQWHPTFRDYPEPGTGWMDENGHLMPMGGGILKN